MVGWPGVRSAQWPPESPNLAISSLIEANPPVPSLVPGPLNDGRAVVAARFERAALRHLGCCAPAQRSGAGTRTPIGRLTAACPAIGRHRNECAVLHRLIGPGALQAFVAGAGVEPAHLLVMSQVPYQLGDPAVAPARLELAPSA